MRYQFRISQPLFDKLRAHLFPGDNDEHGAVIAAGVSRTNNVTRLLARKLFLAQDGVDYVPSKRGYRALTARFVAEAADYCAEHGLAYFAVHPHGSEDEVSFSVDDLDSHNRGYQAIVDLLDGPPMGALVFGSNVVAGTVWTKSAVHELESFTVVGPSVNRMVPKIARNKSAAPHARYDRQSRLFGDKGQQVLSNLKVAIVGLGGVGSLLNQWLAKLGVGEILAIDFDRVEPENLSRIPGATDFDAKTFLVKSKVPFLRKLGVRFSRYKVDVAKRVARSANPAIRYKCIRGSIVDADVAEQLLDVDFIFLAADSSKRYHVECAFSISRMQRFLDDDVRSAISEHGTRIPALHMQ